MSRKALDIIFSAGIAVLALTMVVLGIVLLDQQQFSDDYVKEELSAQKITFATEEQLTEEEKTWRPGSSCLVENAGKLMEKGKQAECYAKYYIAMHTDRAATAAGFPGETYATLGPIRTELQAEVETAKQKGETLRGLLLTSYGFSVFGDKAGIAAQVCFVIAAVLLLVAAAGFIHAYLEYRKRAPKAEPA
jgi:uncharacterized membrane protein